jgi:uncharacterized NAD(P)/FAD-binding protein YdhS
LTAVDLALALEAQNHRGSVTMISHEGRLPSVRGPNEHSHTLQMFTPEAVRAASARNGGRLSLRDILRLFRRKMQTSGEDWREAFRAPTEATALDALVASLAGSGKTRPAQTILAATNAIVEQ